LHACRSTLEDPQLGCIYDALRLTEPAKVAYRRAIELGSGWESVNNLAVLLLEGGSAAEVNEAKTRLTQAVQKNPDVTSVRYNLALAHAKLGGVPSSNS
jgi:hypothetical protein